MGDKAHDELVQCLKELAATIRKPSTAIVVSAHWEESRVTVTSGASPPLIYDYYGFPKESYDIEYPCRGNPGLADEMAGHFARVGIEARLDGERGFDHGLFVPLKIMYPEADIPCVQLSLVKSLDPAEHLRVGEALQDLADQSLLLIGSGFSFHNMSAFFARETELSRAMNESFESWLLDTLSSPETDEAGRAQRLENWEAAPYARYCHPREEHLLPLHVCYGFAAMPCSKSFELQIFNKKSSMYLW